MKDHKTASGVDFYTINPKGNVPAIVLADGTLLNENVATLSWIADQNLSSGLAPANGTNERIKLLNILAFLTSELHPGIGGMFGASNDQTKAAVRAKGEKALNYLEKQVLTGNRQFLIGDGLTIADLYGHIILSWTAYVGWDLKPWPAVAAYLERIKAHPDVLAGHKVIAGKPASI